MQFLSAPKISDPFVMHLHLDLLFSLRVRCLYVDTLAVKHAGASNCGLGTSDADQS